MSTKAACERDSERAVAERDTFRELCFAQGGAQKERVVETQESVDTATLLARVRELERTLREAEEERVRLAAEAHDIDIGGLPNGVRVRMERSEAGTLQTMDREFHCDYQNDGCFELRMDECSLERGVLELVLRRTPPQRVKLRRSDEYKHVQKLNSTGYTGGSTTLHVDRSSDLRASHPLAGKCPTFASRHVTA